MQDHSSRRPQKVACQTGVVADDFDPPKSMRVDAHLLDSLKLKVGGQVSPANQQDGVFYTSPDGYISLTVT